MPERELPQPRGVPGWSDPAPAPYEPVAASSGAITDPRIYRIQRRYNLVEREAPLFATALLCVLWLVAETALAVICVVSGRALVESLAFMGTLMCPMMVFLLALYVTRGLRGKVRRVGRGDSGHADPSAGGTTGGDL